jgi:hypothetical protein
MYCGHALRVKQITDSLKEIILENKLFIEEIKNASALD